MTTFLIGVLVGILLVISAECMWLGWLFGNPNNYTDEPKIR